MKKRKHENINNTNNIYDAMSHIDDDLLDSALLMRRVLQQNQPIKNPARTARKIALLAACLVVATTATVIAVVAAPADQPATETTTEIETTDKVVPWSDLIHNYITLDELYETEPYNRYFPRSGLDHLTVKSCYITIQGEDLYLGMDRKDFPIEYGDFQQTSFHNSPENAEKYFGNSLMISIDKPAIFPEGSYYYNLGLNDPYIPYDTTDVESYERIRHELSYYSFPGEVFYNRKKKAFLAQDVTLEVIENLYHDATQFESDAKELQEEIDFLGYGYRYNFEITILLDNDYTISYSYSGDDITAEMMYGIITSAEYFNN